MPKTLVWLSSPHLLSKQVATKPLVINLIASIKQKRGLSDRLNFSIYRDVATPLVPNPFDKIPN